MLLQYVVGYIVLALVWRFTSPKSVKLFKSDSTHTALVMIIIMLMQLLSGLFFPWKSNQFDLMLRIAAMIVFWFGLIIAVWAKLTMKTNWGTPAQHTIQRQNALVTNGPFRYSRNPIYLGLAFMAIGASIGVKSISVPLVLILLFHFRRMAIIEEQLLTKHFGKVYEDYKRRVPRFLL